MTNIVDIRNLGISFATDGAPVTAVDNVSLTVKAGEVLAIVGESGSGKTVTAKAILGLLPETATESGIVMLGSNDIVQLTGAQLRDVRGVDVAMVFQEPSTALNPVYTVGWQIAQGLRAHGKYTNKQARAKAIEILDKVGIPEPESRVDYYPHQFSGGQKQRVVIAMALVLDPGLIVADEPTTALDVTVQAEILDLLRRCRDEFGTAIVLITHNMGVVADLADRVAVMYNGKIVEEADARTLFSAPKDPYTQRLLASVPKLGSAVERTRERAASRPAVEDAPVVKATNLVIEYAGRFGRKAFRAVDDVSFSIHKGEVLGLVGESGSGKTTIGRSLVALTKVTGGSLTVLGQEMRGVRERQFRPLRESIGFVFQDPASSFNPLLSIAECVAEPLIVSGRAGDARAARPRVNELLEAVQLPRAFGDRFPHELSGGQRQRASLARSLALEPALLIADEPTSALDVSVQAKVLELFSALQKEFGFAALFISHDLAVVDLLADRIAVLYQGKLVEEGTGAEVLVAPKHPYTKRLLASLPVPDPVEQAERRGDAARIARRRLSYVKQGVGTVNDAAVVADDLSIRYESWRSGSRYQAVNGVSFEIAQGEIVALIGESGSGKSTLARTVAGFAGANLPGAPVITGGSLTVLGRQIRTITAKKRDRLGLKVGYVPQDAGAQLDSRLTVGENVADPIFSRDAHFDSRDAGIAVATLIDAVRLPLTTMNKYPHELSRGQRQRVAIARALILEPTLLVADDPTAGIDVTVRAPVLDIIRDLQQQRAFSALVISNALSEVRRFSDRVAVMHKGVIVGIGGVNEVLEEPRHEYVEGLARAIRDIKAAEALSVG